MGMNLKIQVFISILLAISVSFAKKTSPMQMGNTLAPLGKIQIQTAEISAYNPDLKTLFVIGDGKQLELVDISIAKKPSKIRSEKISGDGSSVSAFKNIVAVSSLAKPESDTGFVELFYSSRSEKDNVKLSKLAEYRLCSQPDMLTFTPDGRKILVACEGSPSPDFKDDPAGGIGIISLPENFADVALDAAAKLVSEIKTEVLGFEFVDSTALMQAGVRRIGKAPFYKTLEPEYITVSDDSKIAWVSLQENNALARVDLNANKIAGVFPLGFVDHSAEGFGLDAEKDGKIGIKNWPIRGLRQPDGIAHFSVDGKHYVLSANEGAPVNDYAAWTDETSVKKLYASGKLDTTVFDNSIVTALGKMTVSDIDRCLEENKEIPCKYVYSFGSRSVSIFDGDDGSLLWDSGSQLEETIAKVTPEYFNWNAKKGKKKVDARSLAKGSEPENITIGLLPNGKRYAFVGLERGSGIAVFDITDIASPKLVDYYMDPEDRGPEGMLFIPAEKSPEQGTALLVVGYEYSKTLVIYKVQ